MNLFLANQFMTQLTDKIREGILGNVGTIMSGRLGVTDAELMEKAFSPVFSAEDLHKQGNYQAIATVMMYNLPSAPFTMSLLPPMGEAKPELLETMKEYSAAKYAKTREEVEAEIKERWKSAEGEADASGQGPAVSTEASNEAKASTGAGVSTGVAASTGKESFLEAWKKKKEKMSEAKTEAGVAEEGATSGAMSVESDATEAKKPDEVMFKVRRK